MTSARHGAADLPRLATSSHARRRHGAARRTAAGLARRAALLVAMLAAGGGAFAQPAAGSLPPQPVRNPYWGVALFELYQQRSFAALTSLLASQQFDRVPLHADEAELLRGALLLDIGVHDEAERVFTRLLDGGTTEPLRDRVWLQLAQLRFRKGLHGAAGHALARIGGTLPAGLAETRALLLAQLQLARGDHAGAAATLAAVPPASPLLPYARYNLAVARLGAGDAAGARTLLQELGTQPAAGEELRSLRDKANLALGFDALREGDAGAAVTALERVRLHGPQSNAALLGLGWAALQREEPRRSLVAFRELAARGLRDAAALEAQLAEPYALAEAGASGAALDGYERAIAAFAQDHAQLDATIAQARSGALVEALLAPQPPGRMGGELPLAIDARLPQAGLLAPLLAEHGLQEALRNLGDLRFASTTLAQRARHLEIFDEMLAERRAGFEQRSPQVRERAAALAVPARRSALDPLRAEVAQARHAADGLAHADAREIALQQRLASARAAPAAQEGDPAWQAAGERLRLADGVLRWQLARDHAARQWQADQGLAALEHRWTEIGERAAALEQAQRDEPRRLQAFAQRIAALRTRIATLVPQVAVLAAEQQGQAQELAVAALARQQERLAGYTAQARWAVAQLHDRARIARRADGGDDAPR